MFSRFIHIVACVGSLFSLRSRIPLHGCSSSSVPRWWGFGWFPVWGYLWIKLLGTLLGMSLRDVNTHFCWFYVDTYKTVTQSYPVYEENLLSARLWHTTAELSPVSSTPGNMALHPVPPGGRSRQELHTLTPRLPQEPASLLRVPLLFSRICPWFENLSDISTMYEVNSVQSYKRDYTLFFWVA